MVATATKANEASQPVKLATYGFMMGVTVYRTAMAPWMPRLGATVDDFLAWYEGVTREQVLDVLRHAERSLAAA